MYSRIGRTSPVLHCMNQSSKVGLISKSKLHREKRSRMKAILQSVNLGAHQASAQCRNKTKKRITCKRSLEFQASTSNNSIMANGCSGLDSGESFTPSTIENSDSVVLEKSISNEADVLNSFKPSSLI